MGKRIDERILGDLNHALWAIEPVKGAIELKDFLGELSRLAKQLNMSQLARDAQICRNTMWRSFTRHKDMRFATMVRLCYHMGLRFRLERDPVPRKLDYGSVRPEYVSKVDASGAWDLGYD